MWLVWFNLNIKFIGVSLDRTRKTERHKVMEVPDCQTKSII